MPRLHWEDFSPGQVVDCGSRLVTGLLLGFRVTGVFVWGPFWGSGLFPVRIRVLLIAMVTFLMATAMPVPSDLPVGPRQELLLILLAAKEFALGSAMGLVGRFVIAAVKTAGQIISMQIGMAAANMMDPASRVQVGLMGNVLGLLAIAAMYFTALCLALYRAALQASYDMAAGKKWLRRPAQIGLGALALAMLLPLAWAWWYLSPVVWSADFEEDQAATQEASL